MRPGSAADRFAALQLCAARPSAQGLLRTNPVLRWLLVACAVEQPHCREQAGALLALLQRALLARLLGLPPDVRPAQVRFLRKLVVMEGTNGVLSQIRRLAGDETAVMAAAPLAAAADAAAAAGHGPAAATPALVPGGASGD